MKNKANFRVMADAVARTERGMMRDFGEIIHLQNSRKPIIDFINKTHKRAEERLLEDLQRAKPHYGFASYNQSDLKDENWILFPLIGARNFSHAISFFGLGLSYMKEGNIELAMVRMPYLKEAFFAERHNGAWSENSFTPGSIRLKVSERVKEKELMFGSEEQGAFLLSMAMVAAGRFDAAKFKNFDKHEKATALLLVKEAGGEIEEKGGSLIATNGKCSI